MSEAVHTVHKLIVNLSSLHTDHASRQVQCAHDGTQRPALPQYTRCILARLSFVQPNSDVTPPHRSTPTTISPPISEYTSCLLPFTGHTCLHAYEADNSIAAAQSLVQYTHCVQTYTVAHPLPGEALMTCRNLWKYMSRLRGNVQRGKGEVCLVPLCSRPTKYSRQLSAHHGSGTHPATFRYMLACGCLIQQ
jgi:hypothetical protein